MKKQVFTGLSGWFVILCMAFLAFTPSTGSAQVSVQPNYQQTQTITQTTATIPANVYTTDAGLYRLVLRSVGPDTEESDTVYVTGNSDVTYSNPQSVWFSTDSLTAASNYTKYIDVYRASPFALLTTIPFGTYQTPQVPVAFQVGAITVVPTPTSALVKVPITTNGYPVKVTVYYGPNLVPAIPSDTVMGQDTARITLLGLTANTTVQYYVFIAPLPGVQGVGPQTTTLATFQTPQVTTAYATSFTVQTIAIDSVRLKATIALGSNPSPQYRFQLLDSLGTTVVSQGNLQTVPTGGGIVSDSLINLDPYTKYIPRLVIIDNITTMVATPAVRTLQVPAPTITVVQLGQPTKYSAQFTFTIVSNDPTGNWLPNSLTKAWADIGTNPNYVVTDFDTVTVPNTLVATVLFDSLNTATTYFPYFRAKNKGGIASQTHPFTTAAPFPAPLVAMGQVFVNPTSFVVDGIGYNVAPNDTADLFALVKKVATGLVDTVSLGIVYGSGTTNRLVPNRQASTAYQVMIRARNLDGVWGGMTAWSQSYTTLPYGNPTLLTEPYQVYGTGIAVRIMGSTGGYDLKYRSTIIRMDNFMQVSQSPLVSIVPLGMSYMQIDDTLTMGGLELSTTYKVTTQLLDSVTNQEYTEDQFVFTTAPTAISEQTSDPLAVLVWDAYDFLGGPIEQGRGTRTELSQLLPAGLYVLRSGTHASKLGISK